MIYVNTIHSEMKRQFCQVFLFLLGTLNLENDSNMFF